MVLNLIKIYMKFQNAPIESMVTNVKLIVQIVNQDATMLMEFVVLVIMRNLEEKIVA